MLAWVREVKAPAREPPAMTLELMQPTPTWDAEAHADTVAAFESIAADPDASITVWCRDNCSDCRRELPDFAAAVEAAGVPDERLRQIAVDDDNEGALTDAYGVERIPTIVVERDDEEVARFVEEETLPAAQYLAAKLREVEGFEA
jgi:thiol-disulfide isomerase/thioredoxin